MTTLTKKEIDGLLYLLHTKAISRNPEEIQKEIDFSGSIFGFESMKEAKITYIKLLDLYEEAIA
tara:strand:- start:496 stop:687 length:192 start_codon:yes stop_codon:yes gene_type:complete